MKETAASFAFDFNEWSKLATDDPAAFESRRLDAIEKVIGAMPEPKQQRMRCLQWRIDHERRRSKTPMSACIRLSQMMWDSLTGENGLLDTLYRLDSYQRRGVVAAHPRQGASILNFPASHRQK